MEQLCYMWGGMARWVLTADVKRSSSKLDQCVKLLGLNVLRCELPELLPLLICLLWNLMSNCVLTQKLHHV